MIVILSMDNIKNKHDFITGDRFLAEYTRQGKFGLF
jgi:hypothetical protein